MPEAIDDAQRATIRRLGRRMLVAGVSLLGLVFLASWLRLTLGPLSPVVNVAINLLPMIGYALMMRCYVRLYLESNAVFRRIFAESFAIASLLAIFVLVGYGRVAMVLQPSTSVSMPPMAILQTAGACLLVVFPLSMRHHLRAAGRPATAQDA
jgi:hypothetical protein